jgi:hypothetical protein
MECPFCAETVRDEAIACKHCSRDLRAARPIILEISEILSELDRLRHELDQVDATLQQIRFPVRYIATYIIAYVLVPIVLLVAAHVLVTIELNVAPLYLRLASLIIPLPFGLALYARQKVGVRGSILIGIPTAALAVTCMLTVTGLNDNVSIIPGPWVEWREVIEYAVSIAFAFVTGNIIGLLIFSVLPKTVTRGGKPSALAHNIAGLLGQQVGEEHLRRRARRIQELIRTVGPIVGVAFTAGGSIYTGLKGVVGW